MFGLEFRIPHTEFQPSHLFGCGIRRAGSILGLNRLITV